MRDRFTVTDIGQWSVRSGKSSEKEWLLDKERGVSECGSMSVICRGSSEANCQEFRYEVRYFSCLDATHGLRVSMGMHNPFPTHATQRITEQCVPSST